MVVAVGVLPYPITFICTDLISELYGRRRATEVVFVGLLLNVWVMFLLWLGGALPGFEALDPATGELVPDEAGRFPVFFEIRTLAFGAVTASMIAYLFAQWCDVQLFHFWKWLTGGRHLWLRNNGSTLVSQLVDTTAVILITHFYANALPIVDSEVAMAAVVHVYRLGLCVQGDCRRGRHGSDLPHRGSAATVPWNRPERGDRPRRRPGGGGKRRALLKQFGGRANRAFQHRRLQPTDTQSRHHQVGYAEGLHVGLDLVRHRRRISNDCPIVRFEGYPRASTGRHLPRREAQLIPDLVDELGGPPTRTGFA